MPLYSRSVDPAVGQQLTLEIADVAFGGEGVARAADFVVFVPFVLAGETVEVRITEVKKRFARARLLRVIAASPDRVAPRCRYFGACGGCQYQHMNYEAQLRVKHKQVRDLFQRIGGFDATRVSPVLPCPQPFAYRNRIMIRSQWNKPEQRLNIGFVRADSRLVEDIEECLIAESPINERLREVRQHPPPKGGLKVVLRMPPEDWEVPPDSFFQNNLFLLPRLLETVRGFLERGGARHLLDLYCGVGFFALELADRVESFVGVEYDRNAVRAAMRNAARKGRANGQFLAEQVERALPGLFRKFADVPVAVLLDPPRKGCQRQVLQQLLDDRPAQVIYISCHPATMARDLNTLCAGGVFELADVVPLDMFPQTQHVECVAEVRRRTH
jgi:tRNA/tmRNA/rRNA uracil-C5-methylase (TrmA/RlmC/RlmD family)